MASTSPAASRYVPVMVNAVLLDAVNDTTFPNSSRLRMLNVSVSPAVTSGVGACRSKLRDEQVVPTGRTSGDAAGPGSTVPMYLKRLPDGTTCFDVEGLLHESFTRAPTCSSRYHSSSGYRTSAVSASFTTK
eukprot:3796725-Rhodomonas_salina.1